MDAPTMAQFATVVLAVVAVLAFARSVIRNRDE